MTTGFAILVIIFGFIVLLYGNRLALFGAAVGALLGLAIVRFLPGAQAGFLWMLVPIGLAIFFAFGGAFIKGIISLVTLVFGALAGGAIVLSLLDVFGVDAGFMGWILALVGAIIGAILVSRFKDWAIIILAAIVGALLVVRGTQMLLPSIQGAIASLIGLVLAGGAIAYHGGLLGKK
jgi:hypothetical protein